MTIAIKYIPENLTCGFQFGRMYIFDDSFWYRCVTNFCPHLDVGGGECRDCALVLDED